MRRDHLSQNLLSMLLSGGPVPVAVEARGASFWQMLGIIEGDDYFDLFEEEWIIVWSTLSLAGIVDEMYHIIFLENVWGLCAFAVPIRLPAPDSPIIRERCSA